MSKVSNGIKPSIVTMTVSLRLLKVHMMLKTGYFKKLFELKQGNLGSKLSE